MGRESVSHFGAVNSFPSLERNLLPVQRALTPSNFSEIQYPVGFFSKSHFSANKSPCFVFEGVGLFGIVGVEEVREASYCSPRRVRRCLHVLRFDGPL